MTYEVKLGQSQFQDTFFVANAQLTPFRKLRQLELELNSLNDTLTKSEFNIRRKKLAMSKMDLQNEADLIDFQEAEFDLKNQVKFIDDAKSRKANFELMKKQLLESIPKEYWEQGFENAELEHWTRYAAKQIGMAKALGLPPPVSALEMMSNLPENAQFDVLRLSNTDALKLASMDQQVIHQLQADK